MPELQLNTSLLVFAEHLVLPFIAVKGVLHFNHHHSLLVAVKKAVEFKTCEFYPYLYLVETSERDKY